MVLTQLPPRAVHFGNSQLTFVEISYTTRETSLPDQAYDRGMCELLPGAAEAQQPGKTVNKSLSLPTSALPRMGKGRQMWKETYQVQNILKWTRPKMQDQNQNGGLSSSCFLYHSRQI